MFNNRYNIFSIPKIIDGMSKTLGVFNEVIPIYKETKPIIQNAKNTINTIKQFSNKEINKIISNKNKNIKPLKEKINVLNNVNPQNNNPTFFQ